MADGTRQHGFGFHATGAVRMVGNSVSPPPLAAIAAANLDCTQALRCAA